MGFSVLSASGDSIDIADASETEAIDNQYWAFVLDAGERKPA